MNRSTMRQKTADFCGDPDQTRFSSKYNDSLDRAQEQFALDTRALWKDKSYTWAADDADNNLPADFMYEDWVTWDGKELDPISRHDMQRLYGRDWAEEEGEPKYYIIDPETGVQEIILAPIPQEEKTVAMRYYPLPEAMSSDTSTPLNSSALMVQFHYGLCGFAAFDILMGEPSTPELSKKKSELMALYNDAKDKAIATFKNTASAPIRIRGTRIWS